MRAKRDAGRMTVKAVAKVGSKGRLYLPPEVRDAMKLSEGDYLAFREERGRMYVEKLE
ncbi:MAG TPA: AbrB/MazE/SpoVT family DNA-binding domain-containing protein [Thermoplasmata archaeon]|nr:AbrB/MazE/SpoVT family DNA-binding domain-containing protein [Thermoplasmata archaeon]